MLTLRTIERQIASATDVQSIVRTMKTLAAVNIRQYEAAVAALVPYDDTVHRGLWILARSGTDPFGELPARGSTPSAVIVFGSDRGLCGGFNESVAAFTDDQLDRSVRWSILPVGARVADRLGDRGLELETTLALPGSLSGVTELVAELLIAIDRWRSDGIGRVLVVHNRRRRGTVFEPCQFQLLPIPREDPLFQGQGVSRSLPQCTMDAGRLLSAVVRQYLFASLYRACVESLAGENASRLASMHAAERNITDRLDGLRRAHQQQRQESITAELSDIVSGFEAQRLERATHTTPAGGASSERRPVGRHNTLVERAAT